MANTKESYKKGQSAVEYLLLFSAVILVLIFAFFPQFNGFVHHSVNESLDLAVSAVEGMVDDIDYSGGGSGGPQPWGGGPELPTGPQPLPQR